MQPIDVVKGFLDDVAHNPKGAVPAFRRWLTEDCLWEQSGVPDQHGVEACVALQERAMKEFGFFTFRAQHQALAVTGDLVLNERVDHLVDEAGRGIGISIKVMSSFRVRGDQISKWLDVFNPGDVRK